MTVGLLARRGAIDSRHTLAQLGAAAYWKAADYSGSGDLLDQSGNGLHLAVNGPTFDTDHFTLTTNDYFETADNALLDFGAADSFTLILAMKVAVAPIAVSAFMAKRISTTSGAGNVGWVLTCTAGGSIILRCDDGTTVLGASKTTAFINDTKVLLVGRRDVTADTGYVAYGPNSASAADATTGSFANSEVMRIGRLSGAGTSYAEMTFYGGAVFRRALSNAALAAVASEFGAAA